MHRCRYIVQIFFYFICTYRFGSFNLRQPQGSLLRRVSQHIRGDFVCTCTFPSFGSSSIRSYLARFFPFRLIVLTFKNISLFHRWFYGLAKVGIMQRGEVLQRKLLTCWRGREPEKWKKDIKRNKKKQNTNTVSKCILYTNKKNISIYEKMGKISIGGSICS